MDNITVLKASLSHWRIALDAVRDALTCGHGYVIDCAVEIDEMVRPMVPVGGKITQFLVD